MKTLQGTSLSAIAKAVIGFERTAMRTRLLAAVLLVGAAAPALAFDRRALEEQSTPRLVKPEHARLESFHARDHIRVKFQDGLVVRARSGELTDLGTGALDAARATLANFAGGTWKAAHSVDENTLARLRTNARERLGRHVADPNLQFDFVLPEGVTAELAIDTFNRLACVELADAAQVCAPPPTPPDFQPNQKYMRHAPTGVSAETAWGFTGGTGTGVRVCDIEYSFNASHADLPPVTLLGATVVDPFNSPQHGTAVIGAIAAVPNGFGITGMAHGVSVYFAGANTVNGYHIDAAITAAVAAFSPGDVILIEQQAFGPGNVLVPAEWDVTVYNAIQLAVGNGIVVIEAGANGNQDLDSAVFSTGNNGHWPFLPQNDSGAILVGGGASPIGTSVDRSRLTFSDYGSTIDLQGWGELVYTTGFGSIYSAEGVNQYYTNTFNGTSSATPMIASACAIVQAVHKARTGLAIAPLQLRNLLRATGSMQQAGLNPLSQNIGPRPDIAAAIQQLGDAGATTFCAGDGRGTACPCGNDATIASGRGCVNSLALGSSLIGLGNASLSSDTLKLHVSSISPTATMLLFQGTTHVFGGTGSVFGDSLLCTAGAYVRVAIFAADSLGTASYPFGAQPALSIQGMVGAPGSRDYQVMYRDNTTYCTSDFFSLTNGVTLQWTP